MAQAYSPDYTQAYNAAQNKITDEYTKQRNALAQAQQALPLQYTSQKNDIYSQSAQTAKALDETNAQRGLYRSGYGASSVGRTYNTRDAGINALNLQQQQASDTLANRLAELNNQEATAKAALAGQEGQDLRNYNLAAAGLTGMLDGNQTLAAQQQARQNAYAEAGLTGTYNGNVTADQANQTYQNQLALLQALQNYNLGVGQVTDTLPSFPKFTYGDTLADLLAQLQK